MSKTAQIEAHQHDLAATAAEAMLGTLAERQEAVEAAWKMYLQSQAHNDKALEEITAALDEELGGLAQKAKAKQFQIAELERHLAAINLELADSETSYVDHVALVQTAQTEHRRQWWEWFRAAATAIDAGGTPDAPPAPLQVPLRPETASAEPATANWFDAVVPATEGRGPGATTPTAPSTNEGRSVE